MQPNQKLNLIGFDPSLNNWGIAAASLDLNTKKLTVLHLAVTNPVLSTGKQVRQNSKDLDAAYQLYQAAITATKDAHAVFIEVPVGSQSARAMASYGICVGICGALRGQGIPFFEVTPTEVKLAGPGIKTASKQQMIDWAVDAHPEANWPTYKEKGVAVISKAKAEHMSDSIATIYAGIASTPFQQMLSFRTAQP